MELQSLEKWLGISFGTSAANPLYYGADLYLIDELITELVIPEGVTTMRFGNFTSTLYNSQLALYLPASLTEIHVDTFSYAQPENVTVYCPAGSAAENQARQYGLTVVHN